MDQISSAIKGYNLIIGHSCNLVWSALTRKLVWSSCDLKLISIKEEDAVATENSNLIVIEADSSWWAMIGQLKIKNFPAKLCLGIWVNLCNSDPLDMVTIKGVNITIMFTASRSLSSII